MRYVIGLALAALGLLAASGAGAAPERTPVVQYWFKAEFGIGIDIKWAHDSGSRNEPCSSWSHEEGIYEINAGSIGEIPAGTRAGSFIHPIQGLQSLDKDPHWAILYAAGAARVHVKRTLTQEGQTNACGDVGVMKTKFPPNDCGERTYVSRAALIRPDFRDGYFNFKDILTPPERVDLKVISIDAPAQQLLYRRCGTLEPLASPLGVQNVAVRVFRPDLSKLRNLKLGQRVRLEFVRDARPWACGLPESSGWACTARVDLHVDVRRVKPPR
jgi:hypothetical protein